MKLVLMNGTQQDYVATEEKVIPAGAPAQWVHFRLQPYRNWEPSAGQYWVYISSGGSPGVARIYGEVGQRARGVRSATSRSRMYRRSSLTIRRVRTTWGTRSI